MNIVLSRALRVILLLAILASFAACEPDRGEVQRLRQQVESLSAQVQSAQQTVVAIGFVALALLVGAGFLLYKQNERNLQLQKALMEMQMRSLQAGQQGNARVIVTEVRPKSLSGKRV